jgi:hypothetical protein
VSPTFRKLRPTSPTLVYFRQRSVPDSTFLKTSKGSHTPKPMFEKCKTPHRVEPVAAAFPPTYIGSVSKLSLKIINDDPT